MRRALGIGLLLLAGCAHLRPEEAPPAPEVIAPGLLTVQCDSALDADVQQRIARAARAALPELLRWGRPGVKVTIVVVPSHEALEEAVHRPGYPWLRAWARYDVVVLQSPRTWGPFAGGDADLAQILSHELTHCAMFQASGRPDDWTRKGIPLWFREGMASWAAGQTTKRWPRARLAKALRDRPEIDPIERAEALYRNDPGLVYSTAHWAYVGLLDRFGSAKIQSLLAAMKAGATFRVAFAQALGLTAKDFERQLLAGLRASK